VGFLVKLLREPADMLSKLEKPLAQPPCDVRKLFSSEEDQHQGENQNHLSAPKGEKGEQRAGCRWI